MLMYADGKLIPVNYTFSKKGTMQWHDHGILSDKKTNNELGITIQVVTSSYRGRFSLNKKDIEYSSRPNKALYYYFLDNTNPKRELVVTTERLNNVLETVNFNDPQKIYMIVTWEELTGEEFDYNDVPF